MHRHRSFLGLALGVMSCLSFVALTAFVGAGPSFARERLEPLVRLVHVDFLQPLAARSCASVTLRDHGIVVPAPTPRPAQGSNILTATDCSTTSASNGILRNARGSADATAGSVGFNI